MKQNQITNVHQVENIMQSGQLNGIANIYNSIFTTPHITTSQELRAVATNE